VLVDPRVKDLVDLGLETGETREQLPPGRGRGRPTRGGTGPFLRQDGLEQVLAHEGHDHGRQGGVVHHVCSSCQRSGVPSSGNGLLGLRAFVKLRSGQTGADMGDPTWFRQDVWPHPQAPRLAQTTIGLSRMVRRSGSGCRAQTVPGAYRHIGLHLLERREHAPTTSQQGFRNQQPTGRRGCDRPGTCRHQFGNANCKLREATS